VTYTNFGEGQHPRLGRCSLGSDWALPLAVGGSFDENHDVVDCSSCDQSGNLTHEKLGTDVHRTED